MTYSIVGVRGSIVNPEETIKEIQEWATTQNAEVLVADARVVFGRDHLESAVRHASRAQAARTMVARSVSMEVLRYLSAQRQVADAIRIAGIRRGTRELAVVVFGGTPGEDMLKLFAWTRDDAVLEAGNKSFEVLRITEEEESTVPPDQRADLALEKVALLDVIK